MSFHLRILSRPAGRGEGAKGYIYSLTEETDKLCVLVAQALIYSQLIVRRQPAAMVFL